MDKLGNEINHYYNIYQSIDTLKLGMILQIKRLKFDIDELNVIDDKVMLGESEIANIKNIPLFSNNENIERLKRELEYTTKRFYELQAKYLSDKNNEVIYKKYNEIVQRKTELDNQIKIVEKAVLQVAEDMVETTQQGNLSPRQKAAYQALEIGDYDGALEVLDFDKIMEDIQQNVSLANTMKDRLQTNVSEIMQRI